MIPVIGVPVLNRPDLLHRMLASINYPVANLVIVDNGHVVSQGHVVDNVQRTHIITMPSNLGVAGSWNLIIKSMPFAPWWLIVNSDAWFPEGSLARFNSESRADALVLGAGSPPWCCFAIGEKVVQSVGLFDESLHPAYFEDGDLERRTVAAGIPLVQSDIPVHHDNSSTLAAGYQAINDVTFQSNANYYRDKVARQDFTAGGWSLERRRVNSWD